MKKLCVAVLGVLLLALHLTSQVSLRLASIFPHCYQPLLERRGICLAGKTVGLLERLINCSITERETC